MQFEYCEQPREMPFYVLWTSLCILLYLCERIYLFCIHGNFCQLHDPFGGSVEETAFWILVNLLILIFFHIEIIFFCKY